MKRTQWLSGGLALLVLAGPAHATVSDDAPLDVRSEVTLFAQASKPAPSGSASGSGAQSGSMSFDLLGESKASAEAPNASQLVGTRRFMLTAHQAIGLGTLALLTATVVVGQLNYSDRFGAHAAGTARYEVAHEALAITTLSTFGITGLLALFAPDPYKKPLKVDTALIHKICMIGATLGMATELGLGLYTAGREGYTNQAKLAQVHQIVGYTSLAFMAVGTGVWIF